MSATTTAAIPALAAMSIHLKRSGASISRKESATSRIVSNATVVPMSTTSECLDEVAKGKARKVESMMMTESGVPSLQRYAWISIGAAIATILLKGVAWQLTGSVGLLSDAIESFVNLAGASMALWMLLLAERPADEDHPHGHGKAEYFSSAFEGFLILLAAVSIAYTATERLLSPQPLSSTRRSAGPDAKTLTSSAPAAMSRFWGRSSQA